MSQTTAAGESLEWFLNRLKAFEDVAALLKKHGSIEQAVSEASAALKTLNDEKATAAVDLKKARDGIKDATVKAKDIVEAANVKAAATAEAAAKAASKLLSDAESKSSAIIAGAEQRKADAEARVAKIADVVRQGLAAH